MPPKRKIYKTYSFTRRTHKPDPIKPYCLSLKCKKCLCFGFSCRCNSELTYILVDDVITTGSTSNACVATLREAGATQIKLATLYHG